MKQAIALTSACAIFLMPVQTAIGAEPTASATANLTSPIEVVSQSPSASPPVSLDRFREPVELSSSSAMDVIQPSRPDATENLLRPAEAESRVVHPSQEATATPLLTTPEVAAAPPPSASLSATPTGSAATTMTPVLGPAKISTNAPAPSDKAEIVSALPEETVKQLQEQYRSEPGMISSHGEQPISDGPEQCVAAAQCGNRNAVGFSMLAWGAALAGLIGLIVWIGKAGPDPCCGSESSCCR